jgi:IclR family transcriptional regulator, acetate operon repressor
MVAEPTLIASVQRALSLLDAVGASDRPLPAKALARRTDLPLPTAYHLLRTLVHERYLERSDGGYVLGGALVSLTAPRAGVRARAARCRPLLVRLHEELHAAAYLSVLDETGRIVLAEVVDSPQTPSVDLWVGFDDAAHATALGKAVLASIDDASRRDYLSGRTLPNLTPHTITDSRVLVRQLEQAGPYALDHEEYAIGTACVAAAVPSSSLTAAVAVSVPARQLGRVVERADALRHTAKLIALAQTG